MKRQSKLKRACLASAIVLGLIAMVPVSGWAIESTGWTVNITRMATSLVCQGLAGVSGTQADESEDGQVCVGDIVESMGASMGIESVPAGFRSECLCLEDADNVMASADGLLVGFTVATSAEDEFALMREELEGRGWTFLESGRLDAGTFVKQEGSYRWLFASCCNAAGGTSVVVQAMKGDR